MSTSEPSRLKSCFDASSQRLRNLSVSVDTGIAKAFRFWGKIVSKKPYTVIWTTIIFAIICAVLFVLLFTQELDNEDLFTPNDAESFDDKAYVDSYYESSSDRGRIISVRHPNERQNDACTERLLLKDVESARQNVQEFFRVYQEMEKLVIYYDDVPYDWSTICVKPENSTDCLITSVLDLWKYNETVIMSDTFDPLEVINGPEENLIDRFGRPLDMDSLLGKPDNPNCEDNVNRSSNVEALAMTLIYIYEPEETNGAEIDPESTKWIENVNDLMRDISKDSVLDTYLADVTAIGKESDELIQKDVALLTIGYFLIIFYTNVVLYKNSCLACKMHLSLASVLGIGLALVSAFGLAQVFQLKFNTVVQVLPFLILGLGVDDTFVIIGAYQRVKYDLPVEEKICQTLERAGSSILITSATDFLAFLMGTYTRLPALQSFSAHASLAIFFDFVFQVTFFVAFLVLEARRELRFRNGAPTLGVKPYFAKSRYDEETIQSKPPPSQEIQPVSTNEAKMTANGEPSSAKTTENVETSISAINPKATKKMCGEGQYDPTTISFSTRLAGTYIPSITLHPIGRFAVLAIECIVLGFAIYGCTKVKMDFNYVDMFTPSDSPLATAFDLEDLYFNGDQVFFSVYTKEAAGGDYFHSQDELALLRIALEDDSYVSGSVRTWYEGFSDWLETESLYRDQLLRNGTAPNAESFNLWLQEYLSGPGQIYASSVIFSEGKNPQVISSKIDATTVDIIDGQQSIDLLDSIRDSIETAAPSLDPVPYAQAFLFYDGYRVIAWETVRNVLMAAVGVFVMNIVILANFWMASVVVAMVALTDVMLFGYMYYVDQYFNPVTAINLVLAVGIAVDYSAHIAHSFLIVNGDRVSRAREALEHIGGEVLSGAFTTWLGIVVMSAAEHYIFQSFFKMFFAIVVAGIWHGVIVLPVILSFVGSDPYPNRLES